MLAIGGSASSLTCAGLVMPAALELRCWSLVCGVDTSFGVFCLMLLIVSLAVLLWSQWYTGADSGGLRLSWLLGGFTAGMVLVLLAADLVVLFLGWEIIGVASVLLVG